MNFTSCHFTTPEQLYAKANRLKKRKTQKLQTAFPHLKWYLSRAPPSASSKKGEIVIGCIESKHILLKHIYLDYFSTLNSIIGKRSCFWLHLQSVPHVEDWELRRLKWLHSGDKGQTLWLWHSECCTAGDWGPVMMRGLAYSQRTNRLKNAQWPMKEWREDGCGTSSLWWRSTQEQSHFMLERYVYYIQYETLFFYYLHCSLLMFFKVCRNVLYCFLYKLYNLFSKQIEFQILFVQLFSVFSCLILMWYKMQNLISWLYLLRWTKALLIIFLSL